MKNIEFGPSGWRSFLGLVGAAALLAFTSVSAVVIDNFNDGFALQTLPNDGDTLCKATPDGGNNMVGNFREINVTAINGPVIVEVNGGVLSVGTLGGKASLMVIWDNTNDGCALTMGGASLAASLGTVLKMGVKGDHGGSVVVMTLYTDASHYSAYNFSVAGTGNWEQMSKQLGAPDSIGAGGAASLGNVTAITLTVSNFVNDLDIFFDLLETPVEVAGFDCSCSDGMMNYSWNTTLEQDIASFLVGSCSDAGCTLLGEVAPQGTGFAYKASLAAAGDADVCAMAVLGTNGELETDNGEVVLYSNSCE